jgi:hypothetical protein
MINEEWVNRQTGSLGVEPSSQIGSTQTAHTSRSYLIS